jgi:hypothetical protein
MTALSSSHSRIARACWDQPDDEPADPVRLEAAKVLVQAALLDRAVLARGRVHKDADDLVTEVGVVRKWPGRGRGPYFQTLRFCGAVAVAQRDLQLEAPPGSAGAGSDRQHSCARKRHRQPGEPQFLAARQDLLSLPGGEQDVAVLSQLPGEDRPAPRLALNVTEGGFQVGSEELGRRHRE